jgi:spore maturation protein A
MLNHIWFGMIILAILIAGSIDFYNELVTPAPVGVGEIEKRNLNAETKLGQVTTAALEGATTAVEIAIGLIGVMALWLGVMKVAEEAGLTKIIARMVRPITRWLFPNIPSDHPAVSAMIMNIAANMLGLSNAATPLGLKAMEELDKLNPNKGEATDDMCTFLVINTSAITLIPATAIAIRASMGSANPQMIIVPSILAATCATIVGLTAVKTIQAFNRKKAAAKHDPNQKSE